MFLTGVVGVVDVAGDVAEYSKNSYEKPCRGPKMGAGVFPLRVLHILDEIGKSQVFRLNSNRPQWFWLGP